MPFPIPDATSELTSKKSDVTTFRGAFESVMRQHYPSLLSHVTIKMVPCPSICTDALGILSSLSPYSFDASPSADIPNIADVPIGAIPLLSVTSPEFHDTVNKTVAAANIVYHEYLKSDEGHGFSGQIVMLGDSMGSLLAYEALCRGSSNEGGSRSSRTTDDDERFDDSDMDAKRLLVAPSPRRRRSSSSSDSKNSKLDFEVSDFFMFGSPLSIVLAAKKLHDSKTGKIQCWLFWPCLKRFLFQHYNVRIVIRCTICSIQQIPQLPA